MDNQQPIAVGYASTDATLIVGVIHDLTIGAIIAALYLIFFFIRQRKFPATGTIVDVFIDSTVISGIIGVFWRLSNQHYLGKLSGEEHIYIAIGCAALSFVLLKRLSRSFLAGWKYREGEPHTGQD